MKRFLLALGLLAAALYAPSCAFAQTTVQTTNKTIATCGTAVYTAGKMNFPTLDTTGVLCTSSSGGGGGGAITGTAAAASVPVVAGTGKPFTMDLFSDMGVIIRDASGNNVDWTAAVPVTQSGTWTNTVTQVTAANLNAQVQGAAASGATVSGNPLYEGCRAATTAPTAVTDGQMVGAQCGVEGKRVVLPYSIKELAVRGSTGAITNTTQTSIIASAGGSLKNYITAIQCANSGASTSILTFTDAAATVLINPAGGGGSWTFPIPLATAAATAFQVTPGTSSTSQYCSAQGYTGL